MDKIICVGKNYLKHAQELGDAVPTEPLYFMKPPSSLFEAEARNSRLELPHSRGEIHHELELVLKIAGEPGHFYFSQFTLGLDLTLRDLQSHLKKTGQPWEKAKVFKQSAIVGMWSPIGEMSAVLNLPFSLEVNGEVRQKGLGAEMRFQPEDLLKDVQNWFPLCAGDILFTGTPEGVGPLKVGDALRIHGGPVQYSLTCA